MGGGRWAVGGGGGTSLNSARIISPSFLKVGWGVEQDQQTDLDFAMSITALGDSVRFVPVVRDASGDAVEDTVSCLWQVSDSAIVSVNASGWVTAHRAGGATVTATAPWDSKSGSHAVSVAQEVAAVDVYPATTDTLTAIGDTTSFLARATDRNDST